MGLLDIMVIGGGQAGLAAAFHLRRRACPFVILESADRVGDSWRRRYASLTLITPRRFSSLPGLELAGDPDGYATRDEFADYLEDYSRHFALPVLPGSRVAGLAREPSGLFVATTGDGRTFRARSTIVAAGPFMEASSPPASKDFSQTVVQLTTASYVRPEDVPAGAVLVAGDGASGRDIAIDLAPTRRTLLAAGRPRRLLPESFLGQSIWWWLSRLGLMAARPQSPLGHLMRRTDPFPNRGRANSDLVAAGVVLRTRIVGAHGEVATFDDGSSESVRSVIWSTGYRDRFDWLDIEDALTIDGVPVHHEGVSPVPGLYFLGRPWQRNRASALIMGAGEDAAFVVEKALASAVC